MTLRKPLVQAAGVIEQLQTGDALSPDGTDSFALVATAQTLTNKRVTTRVVTIATGTTLAAAGDTTDVASQTNTQSAGTLTVSNPTGTPADCDRLVVRLKSSNVQTFAWDTEFRASTDLALPASSSGSGQWDYVIFIWNAPDSKWDILAKNFGH